MSKSKPKAKQLEIQYVAPDQLKGWERNPRIISALDMERLKASIQLHGIVDPIIARREDGMILGGHQRVVAAKALAMDSIPVVYLDGVDNARMKVLNLGLNRISGDWNHNLLMGVLDDIIGEGTYELDLTGFAPDFLDTLHSTLSSGDDGPIDPLDVPEEQEHNRCPSCGQKVKIPRG